VWLALIGLAFGADGGGAEVGGSVAANLRFGVATCEGEPIADCRWIDFQDLLVVDGFVRHDLGAKVTVKLAGRLRLHPSIAAEEVGDTAYGNLVQQFTIEVPEGWIELREVFAPAIDLRFGMQRFAWGVALGMNPVDVVNPYDLRDPTRFDQRLGSPAVSARVHHKQFGVEAVWLPLFRPARMPVEIDLLENADDLFDFSDVGGGDLEVGEFETRTEMPDLRLGFGGGAMRVSLAAPFADMALVGFYGYDTLPQVGGEARLVGFATGNHVDIGIPVTYPKYGLAGAELRLPLFLDIGGWVEGAAVFPERVVVTASRGQLEALVDLGLLDEVPDPLPETVMQDGKVFGRWVVGLDRFFGPLSLNAQWIHGLPTERMGSEVGDYASLGARVTIGERVAVRAFGISDFQGVLAGLHLDVLHADVATLTIGGTYAVGPEGSTLGQLHEVSNVSLGVEAAF